jgi:hypothetical protein
VARVSVELPPAVATPDVLAREIAEAARLAMDAELPTVLMEIVQEGKVPRNRGFLAAAVLNSAQPAKIEGTSVRAWIVAAGEAAAYAAVQDLGRRPGKPMSWKVLYYGPGTADWRTGWVNRKLRAGVVQLASVLAIKDASRGVRLGVRGKVTKKNRDAAYQSRAAYLLAVAIARKIATRGMPGKGFIDGQRERIATRVRDLVSAEIGNTIRRLGYGGTA